jgi:lipoyl(octanoyl) transferase
MLEVASNGLSSSAEARIEPVRAGIQIPQERLGLFLEEFEPPPLRDGALSCATGSAFKLPKIQFRDLGRLHYPAALALQQSLVEQRKRGEICDQLLFVEHPHVVTMGRNGDDDHLLASPELLERAGIAFHRTDRGGDVTYHGPGQIVGYPIVDLREWKRDVLAYLRAVEEVIIRALAQFAIIGLRMPGATGVWVGEAKVAAIGVHISRWVTSHGFALNLDTDLSYFRYIVPCGLTKPVTSMRALGCQAPREEVVRALTVSFASVFARDFEITERA